MENVIVIGGGGHAKVVISILKKISKYKILGYSEIKDNGLILGVGYLGDDDKIISKYTNTDTILVIGVGHLKSTELRIRLVEKFRNSGFEFPCIISPTSIINESVYVGEGTVVMDNVVVNTSSRIGKFCILNTSTTIEHDCKVGDFVHIAPGSTLSGEVQIGSFSFIGAGSTVINLVSVSQKCIIGAGSLIRKNISQPGLYVGNPIKKIK